MFDLVVAILVVAVVSCFVLLLINAVAVAGVFVILAPCW